MKEMEKNKTKMQEECDEGRAREGRYEKIEEKAD